MLLVIVITQLIALSALVISLRLAGGAPQPAPGGLPDAGPLTGWALPLVRLIVDLSAVAAIGSLTVALLMPPPGRRLPPVAIRLVRGVTWWALMWAVGAVVLAILTVSEVTGIPLTDLHLSSLNLLLADLPQASRLLVEAAVATALAAYTRLSSRRSGAAVMLAVAVGALLPALLSGHSSASPDTELAISSVVVHVVASSLWVGGLGAMLVSLRGSPRLLAEVLPRYSALALGCFVAVALSGLLNVWVRSSGDMLDWLDSGYGALLMTKTVALAGLGTMGWWHRSRTIARLRDGLPRAFAQLAVVEIAVMAATIAVAVALSRTPTP